MPQPKNRLATGKRELLRRLSRGKSILKTFGSCLHENLCSQSNLDFDLAHSLRQFGGGAPRKTVLKLSAYFLISLTAWAVADTASAQLATADNFCPALPNRSELTWTLKTGVDFAVCTATNAQNNALVGVYFGLFAGFDPKGKTPVREGRLNGEWAKWYSSEQHDVNFKVRIETFVPSREKLWIWVFAQDEESLRRLLIITEALGFRGSER